MVVTEEESDSRLHDPQKLLSSFFKSPFLGLEPLKKKKKKRLILDLCFTMSFQTYCGSNPTTIYRQLIVNSLWSDNNLIEWQTLGFFCRDKVMSG